MTGTAVIITCYNLGRYLDEALESVRRQTRPATELVVIDDGSDDPYSREVLTRVSRSGVFVEATDRRGVASARNAGVELTSSPYLLFLDADDALEPQCIERMAGRLDSTDCAFVTSAIRAFGEASYVWTPPSCNWPQMLVRGGPHISSLFRRAVWSDVGGFDSSLKGYEDLDFWLSAIERGFKGEVLEEPLLRYRVRHGSRYRRVLQPDRHATTWASIQRKHPPPSARDRTNLLVEKDSFLLEQRTYHLSLRSQADELERCISAVRQQIGEMSEALARESVPVLNWGDLRRVTPVSQVWGLDRGKPLDRVYIERFLESHRADIQGRVAEVKDPEYTMRFGSGVTGYDVIDINPQNQAATIVADLSAAESLPANAFDCVVLTQTLHLIYDTQVVLKNVYRSLKPGGVLLCTLPSVSRVSYEGGGLDDGDFWRFTAASAQSAFAEVFPAGKVEVSSHGNVMACAAFLHGLDPGEVPAEILDTDDPLFPLICCVRAQKPALKDRVRQGPAIGHGSAISGAILMYHRVGVRRPDRHGLCLDTEAFRNQMRHLRDCCSVLPLDTLITASEQRDLPPRPVAVTFDDGYAEHLTVVSAILREFGIAATFFVNTANLESPMEHWWDILERVFASNGSLPSKIDLGNSDLGVLSLETEDQRDAAHRLLIEHIYPLAAPDRNALLERLIALSGGPHLPRLTHRPMDADEIRRLSQLPGHSIGAHTTNHLALPLQNSGVQTEEIAECKRRLEQIVDARVNSFAYPYGEYSKQIVDLVREAGFSTAVTVDGRPYLPGAEPFLLPRFEVSGSRCDSFEPWLDRVFHYRGSERILWA
jgi:peptidoglycan/xylan/chitin deacetylase (PgdA/CDA1 family)